MTHSDESDGVEREAWRERLEARPLPESETPPWDRLDGEAAYEAAAESAAHAFLVLADEQPDRVDDEEVLWQAFKDRWPTGNEWLGGLSGFQAEWARAIVRFVIGKEPVVEAGS